MGKRVDELIEFLSFITNVSCVFSLFSLPQELARYEITVGIRSHKNVQTFFNDAAFVFSTSQICRYIPWIKRRPVLFGIMNERQRQIAFPFISCLNYLLPHYSKKLADLIQLFLNFSLLNFSCKKE